MKKTVLVLTALLLLVTAGCTNKWQGDRSNIPQDLLDQDQALLEENLAKLEDNPQDSQAAFEVAYRYYLLGDYKSAEQYYLKTVEIDPSNYVAYSNLMNLYKKVEEYDAAAEAAKKLYNLQSNNLSVLEDVIKVLLLDNDPDSAQSALEYYSTHKEGITADEQQELSDLYQSIVDYRSTHEQ